MKILYIFPHPDDEAFGPAPAIDAQVKAGHDVYLQTWTRGGATKERFKLGLSIEEMGRIRAEELRASGKVLGLAGQEILDFEDSGLKFMDPRILEDAVKRYISEIRPEIVITYPVHGISGFHDHLVAHAVVKRVFLEMRDQGADYLKRLAFFTVGGDNEEANKVNKRHKLSRTPLEELGCIYNLAPENLDTFKQSLDCYKTYQDVIAETGVYDSIGDRVCFEIFGESIPTPLSSLTEGL